MALLFLTKQTCIVFSIGFVSGLVFMFIVAAIYAIRNPQKLSKPVEDFQNRKQTKEYQDLLNQYERNKKS